MPAAWHRAPHVPELSDDEAHVWKLALAAPPAAAFERVLDAEERARASSFLLERDRAAFTSVRGCLRVLLGRYLDCSPTAIAFGCAARGKPHLAGASAWLRFNVSHSGGFGLLAFARDREVGVDIERERPLTDLAALVDQSLSLTERAMLHALPRGAQSGAFFRCWSRKEAVVKATGEGIAQLDQLDVELRPGHPARMLRQPEGAWRLYDLPPIPGHAAALAVAGAAARVAHWEWFDR